MPSSSMMKSLALRPKTSFPALSLTSVGANTTFDCVRKVGAFCPLFSCACPESEHANIPNTNISKPARADPRPSDLSRYSSPGGKKFCFCQPLAVIQPIAMKTDPLRQHLVNLLTKAEAHVDLESSLKEFPGELRGRKPEGSPHTPWQLLEHLRIAQWDILEFSKNLKHVSPEFPDGYWPKGEKPPNKAAWDQSVQSFQADLDAMQRLVADPSTDLFAPIPHGD